MAHQQTSKRGARAYVACLYGRVLSVRLSRL
jgi:hypothetical protein